MFSKVLESFVETTYLTSQQFISDESMQYVLQNRAQKQDLRFKLSFLLLLLSSPPSAVPTLLLSLQELHGFLPRKKELSSPPTHSLSFSLVSFPLPAVLVVGSLSRPFRPPLLPPSIAFQTLRHMKDNANGAHIHVVVLQLI